jgi:hypothetical protein
VARFDGYAAAQATLKSAPDQLPFQKKKPLAGLLDGNSEGEGLGGEHPVQSTNPHRRPKFLMSHATILSSSCLTRPSALVQAPSSTTSPLHVTGQRRGPPKALIRPAPFAASPIQQITFSSARTNNPPSQGGNGAGDVEAEPAKSVM